MLAETIKLSLRTIMRNALRSFLTVLGIVIGVGAVIAMVALGQGTTAQVTSDVAKLGSNLLMVRAARGGPGPDVSGGRRQELHGSATSRRSRSRCRACASWRRRRAAR